MKPFALDLNLDDEEECREFAGKYPAELMVGNTYWTSRVAGELGLSGPGAEQLAFSLVKYATLRVPAFDARRGGDLGKALALERRCDRIYAQAIAPVCECW